MNCAPSFGGERQAASAERRAQARRGVLSACRGVGCRSVVRLGDDVLTLGACHCLGRMFGRGCRVGNRSRIVLPCARTREAATARRPCDNVYIIARHSPAPGVLFKSFRAFRSPKCPHQLPPPSLSIKKLPLPHFLHLHSLKHITMPLSLKISPTIEFLSFRQANYALNPKQTLLRDFKGIIRNQRGTAQSTTY